MLLTSKDKLMEMFPKTGSFYAIWDDIDTEAMPVNAMTKRKAFAEQQYTWVDGKLYQEILLSTDEPLYCWTRTNVEDEVEFLKVEAEAVMFVTIPEHRRVF